jgi:hypothetical protein
MFATNARIKETSNSMQRHAFNMTEVVSKTDTYVTLRFALLT